MSQAEGEIWVAKGAPSADTSVGDINPVIKEEIFALVLQSGKSNDKLLFHRGLKVSRR